MFVVGQGHGSVDHDELYDIRPYMHLDKNKLNYANGRSLAAQSYLQKYEDAFVSFDVDENFKVYATSEQERIKRGYRDSSDQLNRRYRYLKYVIKELCEHGFVKDYDEDKGSFIIPKEALLFFWKQASYLHPDDADSLASFLTSGFKGLIPVNSEWVQGWKQRAALLRDKQWYIPKEGDQR